MLFTRLGAKTIKGSPLRSQQSNFNKIKATAKQGWKLIAIGITICAVNISGVNEVFSILAG